MTIFLTGATGYIGSVITEHLLAAGHRVTGLARSEKSAAALAALGAEPVPGSLEDCTAIARAARAADGVIHAAAELSPEGPRLDRIAVEAIAAALVNTGKPFVYTSGVWVMGNTGGHMADEETPVNPVPLVAWRAAHERIVLDASGLRGIVIRPAMVYGRGNGFLGQIFQPDERGVAHYVGTGENRWSFVDVDDLAELYRLALNAPASSVYFAAAGPALAVPIVAQAASRGAPLESLPLEEARRRMGPLADALALDCMVTARKAIEELAWKPAAPPVLEALAHRG